MLSTNYYPEPAVSNIYTFEGRLTSNDLVSYYVKPSKDQELGDMYLNWPKVRVNYWHRNQRGPLKSGAVHMTWQK